MSDLKTHAGPVPSVGPETDMLVRRDQLDAVRQSILRAIPVNVVLGFAILLVAVRAGHWSGGLIWFTATTILNLVRIQLCRAKPLGATALLPDWSEGWSPTHVDQHLRLACLASLMLGIMWAFLPILCEGYTSAQTLFYITVTCGTTAGAVTYCIAYSRVPICFILPPLLSIVGCLLHAGGFDRDCLAAVVLLYLFAMTRGALATEKGFQETSRLKIQATALARSSEAAHASASALADEMGRRATHDDLTGLLNRAGFAEDAKTMLRHPAAAHCLMLLDLDGFKSVNDIYGHTTGDRVLKEVAKRIGGVLPKQCIAGRLGGDEFAVLYDPADVNEAPAALAERLIGVVAEPFESFDAGRLGMSVGIHHAAEIHLSSMLSCADEALYAAKHAGRNRFRVFDDGLRHRLDMRRDCERDLSKALAGGSLEVWFQPIFGQGGRVVAGVEGLLRWQHPVHGWVPPGEIIAIAAMAGLTEHLLRCILDRICTMMRRLRDDGRTDIRVAMNVSPREMAQVAVDEIILERLSTLGLPPAMLEVEITEETALDIDVVRDRLVALDHAGVRIALDDFGTGYSSLASLRQLRAGRVKIDRSLVTGLTTLQDKKAMVQAVLSLGQTLGLEVVAEGIETAEEVSALKDLGCRFMQGYYLCRPVRPDDAIAMVINSRASAA